VSNLFLTLIIAFVIIVLAIASLAIGWLITGKTRLQKGACGRDPTKKQDESCQSICEICTHPETEQPKETPLDKLEDRGESTKNHV
jgi:hypothetical protein